MKRNGNLSRNLLLTTIAMVVLAMGWALDESWSAEEKYPQKPIRVIIAFPPGSSDMSFRPFTEKIPTYLGQPMAFVYKPGATGSVGASFAAKAEPDGYTLFGTPRGPLVLAPMNLEGLDYSLDSFVPIVRLSSSPQVVAVKADSPWKTIKDLMKEAKKSPGMLTYSHSGVLGNSHLPMEMFKKSAGIELNHVPCAGSGESVTALLGGHVHMASATMPVLSPHVASGALRLIGVFEDKRMKAFPNVSTFGEEGFPVVLSSWYGFVAPKGTPKQIIEKIHTAFKRVIEDHRSFIDTRLEKMFLNLDYLDPQEFAKELKRENETLRPIVMELRKTTKQ